MTRARINIALEILALVALGFAVAVIVSTPSRGHHPEQTHVHLD